MRADLIWLIEATSVCGPHGPFIIHPRKRTSRQDLSKRISAKHFCVIVLCICLTHLKLCSYVVDSTKFYIQLHITGCFIPFTCLTRLKLCSQLYLAVYFSPICTNIYANSCIININLFHNFHLKIALNFLKKRRRLWATNCNHPLKPRTIMALITL